MATVGRKFTDLIAQNQSSVHWLLLRTQAIGDAGESDTAIKLELQKLKARMKEVYHRKFVWNGTRLGVDGLFIFLDTKHFLISISIVIV